MVSTQRPTSSSTRIAPAPAIPRPSHAAAPYLTAALLAAAAGAAGMLPARVWTALLAGSLVGGTGAAILAFIRREQMVSAADAWIAEGRGPRPTCSVLRERSKTLVTSRHRDMVARSLRRIVLQAAQPPRRSAQVPLDSAAVRACSAQLLRLAADLSNGRGPVSARGVALAERLITDPGSPIYRHANSTSAALDGRLRQTLFELERSL